MCIVKVVMHNTSSRFWWCKNIKYIFRCESYLVSYFVCVYRWIKKATPLRINSLILAQTHLAISLFLFLSREPLYCKKWDYGLNPVSVEVRRGLEPCALAEEHQEPTGRGARFLVWPIDLVTKSYTNIADVPRFLSG